MGRHSVSLPRRRWLQGLALASGFRSAADAQAPQIALDVLRDASRVHGTALSDERLGIIRPALERRLSELQALRDFEPDEGVGPTQGILAE
jgi:hypothetical protein